MMESANGESPAISPPRSFRPIGVDDPDWPTELGALAQDIVSEWDASELTMPSELFTLEIVADLTEQVHAVSRSPFVSSVLVGALVHESLPRVTALGAVGLGLVEPCEPYEVVDLARSVGDEDTRIDEADGLEGLVRVTPATPAEDGCWVQWLLAGDPTVVGVGLFEGPAWAALADSWTVSFELLAQESALVGLHQ